MSQLSLTAFSHHVPGMVLALVIFVIGILMAYLARSFIQRCIKIENNKMLKSFSTNLIFGLILLLTLITTLGKLGVPTASLVAVMGAAGLAVGLALRDFLSNIAAGFMIVFLKPFGVGHYIQVNGNAGTIVDINLFMTQLRTSGNECLFIPNSKVITNAIINQSYYETCRVDLVIGIDYAADLQTAKEVITAVLADNALTLKDPAPIIGIQELANSSVNLLVRFWVERINLLNAKFEVLEACKERLTKAGINLPFPQLDVHLKK
jgi:small conductance mechanosensitive channel